MTITAAPRGIVKLDIDFSGVNRKEPHEHFASPEEVWRNINLQRHILYEIDRLRAFEEQRLADYQWALAQTHEQQQTTAEGIRKELDEYYSRVKPT